MLANVIWASSNWKFNFAHVILGAYSMYKINQPVVSKQTVQQVWMLIIKGETVTMIQMCSEFPSSHVLSTIYLPARIFSVNISTESNYETLWHYGNILGDGWDGSMLCEIHKETVLCTTWGRFPRIIRFLMSEIYAVVAIIWACLKGTDFMWLLKFYGWKTEFVNILFKLKLTISR